MTTSATSELPEVPRDTRHTQAIEPWQAQKLARELATGEKTQTQLAKEYGVNRSTVCKFAKKHKARIDEIRAHLDDEFAGLWLADKAQRIASYQDDYELSRRHPKADYFEQIRTRNDIRKAVAEELGQLPARGVAVSGTVTHVLEGVDLDELR